MDINPISHSNKPSTSHPTTGRIRRIKPFFTAALALLMISCTDSVKPGVADMKPVGDGLRTIGYSLIGVAVVLATGFRLRL